MTTFHSERIIDCASLELLRASPNEPDAIGIEAWLGEIEVFSIYFEANGRKSIRFASREDIEFDAGEFKTLIDTAWNELAEWDAALRKKGGTWHPDNLKEVPA